MNAAEVVLFSLTGIVAGTLGGLLGIGGGLVVVPVLAFVFHLMDVPQDHLMQVAIGTSLGAMIFTTASSAWAHIQQQAVSWKDVRNLAPGIVLGAILGAWIADILPSPKLKLVFGIFMVCVGIYFIVSAWLPKREGTISQLHLLTWIFIGIMIGALSSIMGIGGGLITVPILMALNTPIRNAISTSAVTGALIAFIGAVSFLYLGLNEKTFPGSIGYLYIPAFICIGISSALAAPLGAKLTYVLPTGILKQIFGGILILVGLLMSS